VPAFWRTNKKRYYQCRCFKTKWIH